MYNGRALPCFVHKNPIILCGVYYALLRQGPSGRVDAGSQHPRANLITKYPACSGRCDDGEVYSA